MIVQAAKIIGSGLATIGLTNILLSLIHNNKYLVSDIIYTDLAKKAIFTVDEMIVSLAKNSILYKFREIEIPQSTLHINAKNINGNIVLNNYIPLNSNIKKRKSQNRKVKLYFNVAGVYLFKGPSNEKYVGSGSGSGSCMDFYSRLIEHKDQFNNKRRPAY